MFQFYINIQEQTYWSQIHIFSFLFLQTIIHRCMLTKLLFFTSSEHKAVHAFSHIFTFSLHFELMRSVRGRMSLHSLLSGASSSLWDRNSFHHVWQVQHHQQHHRGGGGVGVWPRCDAEEWNPPCELKEARYSSLNGVSLAKMDHSLPLCQLQMDGHKERCMLLWGRGTKLFIIHLHMLLLTSWSMSWHM